MSLVDDIKNLPSFIFSNGVRYRMDGWSAKKDVNYDTYERNEYHLYLVCSHRRYQ